MSKTTVLRTVVFVLVLSLLVSAVPLYADILINSRPNEISTGLSFDSMPNGSNVIITAGKDDSRRHLTWDSYSESEEYVEWIEADKLIDGALPAGCYRNTATKYGAICRAEITDMVSGARYAYRVGSDLAGWSDIYYINANDMQDESFSFILVGDPQINTNVDGENWNITLEKARSWFGDDIEFIISAGDQVNAGESESEYDQFISPDYLRSTPLITIVGNHDDRASNYSSHFTYTDVDQSTVSTAGKYSGDYWVEYDGTLIMSLNVQNESIALHRSFMEKAVAEYTEAHGEPAWTMVSFHDSLFSGAASRYQEEWENRDIYSSIFSELGVDAVMMGHDHIYTRTYMINDTEIINDADLYTQIGDDPYASIHNPEDGDVVFITANSSSGSKFYEITDKPLPFAACANQENTPNFTKVDVTADSMVFTTYRTGTKNELGDIVDFFAIHRTKGFETDDYAPVLTVPRETYFYTDEEIDLYTGVSAYDNRDGDVTDKITVTGSVNPTAESIVTYTATDAAGNTSVVERRLIPINSDTAVSTEKTTWKYLDDGSYPFQMNGDQYEWTKADFDDSQWKEAKGAFGSIDGELADHNGVTPATLINLLFPEGTDEEGETIPNFFFRTTFDINDPENVSMIVADLSFDDALNIYINGVKIKTLNCFLAGGNVGFSGNERDDPRSLTSTYLTFTINDKDVIDSLNLKKEGNILAVELFQGSAYSNDIFFNFEALNFCNTANKLPFEDVTEGSWYYDSVAKAYSKGLFAGTTDTLFSPKMTMTRAMTWTVLARIAGADITTEGKWYEGAQSWAIQNGVSDGTNLKNDITREQLAVMLYGLSGKPETEGSLDIFTDKGAASSWAEDGLIWAVSNGILSGKGNGILDPKATATRAEACAMLIKYLVVK